ncbi:hypothetical protein MPSEU_000532100 [Mayamaea pseudoterrestris]|nr:hypothetical protein MPSEU_000532100 [Mayamaea pseudoterrestris]
MMTAHYYFDMLIWLLLFPSVTAFFGFSTPRRCFIQQLSRSITRKQIIDQHLHRSESDSECSTSYSNRLSHIMLKVPSVDGAVEYLQKHVGATLLTSRRNEFDEYKSAFLALGNGTAVTNQSFALEVVTSKAEKIDLGNVLVRIGVSRLLQFQKLGGSQNIQALVSSASTSLPPEPNGLPIQWATSSPGDYLCRIGLRTNDMEATTAFYRDLFGMQVAAADEHMLCLRYPAMDSSCGVSTTLVFEPINEPLVHGNCFDHLVIRTRARLGA